MFAQQNYMIKDVIKSLMVFYWSAFWEKMQIESWHCPMVHLLQSSCSVLILRWNLRSHYKESETCTSRKSQVCYRYNKLWGWFLLYHLWRWDICYSKATGNISGGSYYTLWQWYLSVSRVPHHQLFSPWLF